MMRATRDVIASYTLRAEMEDRARATLEGAIPSRSALEDTSPLRGSLCTVEVLKRLASYMHQMEGLPLDCCLRMALEVLGVQHRDADVYVRAAKAQMGGEA